MAKMVQYSWIVLLVAFAGANGFGSYDRYDFISSGICYERSNALLSQINSLLDSKKQIRTMTHFTNAAIYEQSWNSSSFKRYSECKFTLQAQDGYGLLLTISKMNMRRDPKGNCIDTMTIKQTNGKKTRFCYSPKDVPRSFSDQSHMKITIKLDHFAPLPTIEDTLHVMLIATQTKECTGSQFELACEPFVSNSCIDKSFRNDGKVNCPNCKDEPKCEQEPLEPILTAYNSTEKIVLTAFVSLLTTALLFGVCFLCMYKSRQMMQPFPRGTTTNNGHGGTRSNGGRIGRGRTSVVATVHSVELRGSSNDLRPSAPPALEEKDLPPSYDALFPTTTAVASSASGPGPTTVSTATSPTIPKTGLDREEADLAK
uniref:Secreted mucin n=1 Tax=Anopheles farauti TaxID=69004 RepID=A0A182QGG4_9DIPT